MNITCPQCGFSREVSPDRIPAGRAIATCPKCSCRFRFSANGSAEILPPKGWQTMQGKPEENPEVEEIRAMANEAYQKEAEKFQDPQEVEMANPWAAAPEPSGWFAAFYQTVLRVMFQAPAFFRGLPTQSALGRPLIFFLIIAIVQTLSERIWGSFFQSMLEPGLAGDPQMEQLLKMLAPTNNIAMALLERCAMVVLQIYFFAFLMYLVYRALAPHRASFALVFQILAYSAAPALLCVIPALGTIAGTLWGLGCMLVGCKSAMNLNWPKTLLGFAPMLLITGSAFLLVVSGMPQ